MNSLKITFIFILETRLALSTKFRIVHWLHRYNMTMIECFINNILNLFFKKLAIICASGWVKVNHSTHEEVKDKSPKSCLSSTMWSWGPSSLVISLGSKCLYQLSHLSSPGFVLLNILMLSRVFTDEIVVLFVVSLEYE